MLTSDFNYNLPPELIAQEPPAQRGASRMLVLHRQTGRLEHRMVHDLPEYLRPHDLLVLNDTRVFPARLLGRWSDTNGAIELLLVQPHIVENTPCESHTTPLEWLCMTGSGRPIRPGQKALFANNKLMAEFIVKTSSDTWHTRLSCDEPLMELLETYGLTPVPPYIQRDGNQRQTQLDRERYQTIYARATGAVAAPTAGLHFTEELFNTLEQRGVHRTTITLHVGPGTFKPIKSRSVEEHTMDSERYIVTANAAREIAACRGKGARVVAVGSTSVRTLESVARQNHGCVVSTAGSSSIFIHPPYKFLATDALLTNFHLPQSTLLMMVSALAGREVILHAYSEAIRLRYRFFSYGDCMLIL